MKKFLLILILVTGIVISCTDRDDDIDMMHIRIRNNSEISFTEVRITQKDTVYENIDSGAISEYIEFESAFERMALTVQTDSSTYNYVPTEIPNDSLPIGLYTYELDINDENEIDFTFTIDY